MPAVVPGVASRLWRLSDGSRAACLLLADALPEELASPVISSGQPKADDTAAVIASRRGLLVEPDARVAEVDQGDAWYEGDYRARAEAYLAGEATPGWEPRQAVAARFGAAIEALLDRHGDGDALVVNHGLALSLYLDSRSPAVQTDRSSEPLDLVPFWKSLTFPDAWRLDLEENTLTRLFFGGIPGD
jgi:broad specificity phosphatase PhoE